jgi:hypothetical protein
VAWIVFAAVCLMVLLIFRLLDDRPLISDRSAHTTRRPPVVARGPQR